MARFDSLIQPITAALAARKEKGASTDELAVEIGKHRTPVGGALAKMGHAGLVAWHLSASGLCHNRRQWYLPQHKPKIGPLGNAAPVRIAKAKTVALDRSQPCSGKPPKTVQCPNYEDRRFRFDPPPGWVGEITRDWQDRRQRDAQA